MREREGERGREGEGRGESYVCLCCVVSQHRALLPSFGRFFHLFLFVLTQRDSDAEEPLYGGCTYEYIDIDIVTSYWQR